MKSNKPVERLDTVALTTSQFEPRLSAGQVGTVVEILAEGRAFEVEFADREGRTFASLGLRSDQFLVLHHDRPEAADETSRVTLRSGDSVG